MFGSGGVELAYEMGIAEGPQSTSWEARAQIIAGLTRGPRGGEAPASCQQRLRHLPHGHLAPAAGCGLLAGLRPTLHVFLAERRCLLSSGLASWGGVPLVRGEGGEGGPFKARLLGHVVLNTCSFYLLISPRCSKSRGRKGVSQSPEELVQKIKVRVCPNDPLKGLSKLAAKVTSLPCPLLLSPTPLPTSASETAVRGRGGLRHPSWTLRGEPER